MASFWRTFLSGVGVGILATGVIFTWNAPVKTSHPGYKVTWIPPECELAPDVRTWSDERLERCLHLHDNGRNTEPITMARMNGSKIVA